MVLISTNLVIKTLNYKYVFILNKKSKAKYFCVFTTDYIRILDNFNCE